MLELVASIMEALAYAGAGNASALLSYQPKTPACLMDDED